MGVRSEDRAELSEQWARHWKCRNRRTRFASSNLARSATKSGSRRTSDPNMLDFAGAMVAVANEQTTWGSRHFLTMGVCSWEMPRPLSVRLIASELLQTNVRIECLWNGSADRGLRTSMGSRFLPTLYLPPRKPTPGV